MTTLILILTCVVLSFFFSGMESGVLLLNRARIRHLKESGSRGARILLDLMHRPGQLSATVLVGNTIVNSCATVLLANAVLQWKGPWVAAVAVMLFAVFLWFVGDMLPKALFRRFPNRLTTRLAPLIRIAYLVFWPIVQLFQLLSHLLVRLMGGSISPRHMFVTRDELKLLSSEVSHGTSLSGEQSNLVTSILDSPHATARDVMRPRAQVVTVPPDSTDEERRKISVAAGFSRFPIARPLATEATRYEGLWVVYDSLFEIKIERNLPRLEARMKLEEILVTLRKAKSPMGIVKDVAGNEIGIVTVEDVLRRYIGKMEL